MKIQLRLSASIVTTILLCVGLFFTPASAFNTTKTFLNTQTHTLAPAEDSAGSIIVRSPNGGEQISAGDNVVIYWDYKGNFKYVEIILLKNDRPMGAVKSRIFASKKQFTWRAGHVEMGGGTKLHGVGPSYKVLIVSGNGKYRDSSNRNFTIKPEPSIVITSPKRGDVLHEGQQEIIRWKSKNLSGMAIIDLIYTRGGSGSATITRKVPVTQGYFVWKKAGQTLRGPASANLGNMIRIRCNQTIGMSGQFEIKNVPPLTGPKIVKTTHPFIIGGNPNKGVVLKKEHSVKKMTQFAILPDLKVVELKVNPFWDTHNFRLEWTLKVKNVGRADIVNTHVLIGNSMRIQNWYEYNPDDHLLNLKANQIWETTYTATIPYGIEAQPYKVDHVQFRWNIDAPNKVKELSETNNTGYYNVHEFPWIDDQNKNRRVEGKTKIIRY